MQTKLTSDYAKLNELASAKRRDLKQRLVWSLRRICFGNCIYKRSEENGELLIVNGERKINQRENVALLPLGRSKEEGRVR